MLFNSIHFLLFFVIVTSIYFLLPYAKRWMWLLAASCYFYMAFIPVYILILGFTIVIDYFAGILIENEQGKRRKLFLLFSLIANIGVLAVFKYYNFLNENLSDLLHSFGYQNTIPNLSILLPIGLSFHTFQAMSYTIEVYRGHQKAERHFGIYSLYVMFYPQLVAGPIERPQNLLHQFRSKFDFDYDRVVAGLKLMVWGLFMKLVVADRVALYVNAVYNNPEAHGGKTFALATALFSIQIYCDFAGYSNIAIGAAKVMGFNLMTNFNRPYFSKSIDEFWKRWHISLSTWFKDYLYISLGGNRVPIHRWYFNLLFVFLVSGLWHGANWTFVLWGAINGVYLISAIVFSPLVYKLIPQKGYVRSLRGYKVFQIIVTFVLSSFAWIFFRANSTADAFYIVRSIFSFDGKLFVDLNTMMYGGLAVLMLFFIEFVQESKHHQVLPFVYKSWLSEHFAYIVLVVSILLLGVFDGGQFIYFQF